MNWRRHFGPCCGLHSLACTLIFKLLLCPIDRYDVYLYGHQCQKHLNKSWVFMWTCYSWSCNAWRTCCSCRIEIGETTWSFSRNVKLDFSDEHLPKFKWYILQLVEYISGGSETSPPTKILHRTFCFHDSMTLSMKDQQRTNLWNQYINNVTIRLYRR